MSFRLCRYDPRTADHDRSIDNERSKVVSVSDKVSKVDKKDRAVSMYEKK